MPEHPAGYRFGVFEVDLRSRELRKGGSRLRVQDQPFEVLTVLLEQYPNLVTRDDLRKRLWDENTFVEFDHGLNNAIGRIRDALGDSAESPRFIETVPRRGYRFVAPVERLPPRLEPKAQVGEPAPRAVPAVLSPPWPRLAALAVVAALVTTALAARSVLNREPGRPVTYTQVTNFNDNAFAPALSPDGRMIAFIRAREMSFPSSGELYSKLLPAGDAVRLTHDSLPKYAPTFTPDGSRITYTVADPDRGWNTMAISPLGGEPRPLLVNAAGLTWLDAHHVLFAQITSGLHMGLVTATDSRAELRQIYLPEHERGMAHYGYVSPDGRWTLIVEMGPTGAWQRCRLVPFDGASAGSAVGPGGACTSAAWAPDGREMYFTATVNGSSHVWRQAFPDGRVEQVTFGPAEEAGIAMSADGRSLFTSVGMSESGVWIHDSKGDRLLSSEGYASQLSLSRDGAELYYLLRRPAPTPASALWVTDVASGTRQPVVQGFFITSYDVAPDGTQVVFAARRAADGRSELWLTPRDHHAPPRLLSSSGEDTPFFGPRGDILFRMSDGHANYLFTMKIDGSGRRKLIPGSIMALRGMSPDREWAVTMIPVDEVSKNAAVVAVPVRGGTARQICPAFCMARWTPDGRRFYVGPIHDEERGAAVMIPVPDGASLPWLPPSGIESVEDSAHVPGSRIVDLSVGQEIAPGPSGDAFVYTRTVTHRNLFRIQLP
jgi:DNA-binding winged helix-turn-helix (wHTH) protein/Tol biopolymer transport system component